jgi:hypothetical protein
LFRFRQLPFFVSDSESSADAKIVHRQDIGPAEAEDQAHALYGEGTPEARAWIKPLLHQLRHGKEAKVVRSLEALLMPQSGLRTETRADLRTPVEYFQTHRDHFHYQQVAKQGGPIGSGSVESLCSQFQDRFKRTGQFWSRPGFGHLISLDVLLRNQDYDFLWN